MLVNTELNKTDEGECNTTNRRGGGTFEDLGLAPLFDSKYRLADLTLTYYPGPTSESYTLTCTRQAPFAAPADSLSRPSCRPAQT